MVFVPSLQMRRVRSREVWPLPQSHAEVRDQIDAREPGLMTLCSHFFLCQDVLRKSRKSTVLLNGHLATGLLTMKLFCLPSDPIYSQNKPGNLPSRMLLALGSPKVANQGSCIWPLSAVGGATGFR